MEIETIIIASISLGFATGFHCLGMCGPIALTIGMNRNRQIKYYLSNFSYQLGRITTYVILGIFAGLVGQGFGLALSQRWVSVATGILLILMSISGIKKDGGVNIYIKILENILNKIRQRFSQLMQKNSIQSRFGLGLLNGLLPCGMVYVALTSSIGTGNWSSAALFMFFFGLGTFPFMFCMVMFGSFMTQTLRVKILKGMPFVMSILGILFILRGMDLDIPYLSPPQDALQATEAVRPHCH